MSKKTKTALIAAITAVTALVCLQIPAVASYLTKTVEIAYRDIKIYINGSVVDPKDASGAPIEPFILNGTTYLPVRAVAEALGMPVEWDGETHSVYLGDRPAPNGDNSAITEITVGTAEELVNAFGSNRKIILKPGVYNLSKVDSKTVANPQVRFSPTFDGQEIFLNNIRNMSIEGSADGTSEIVVDPRYSYVLSFDGGSGINITNVKAGHTEGGYCQGGVFRFSDCSDVTIGNIQMYGCGTIGLDLLRVKNMTVRDSVIYNCTYGIMTVWECKGVTFKGCEFRDNEGYTMVTVAYSSDVTIDSSQFLRNKSLTTEPLFFVSQSTDVSVTNSVFKGNTTGALSSTSPSDTGSGGLTIGSTNTFTDNSFT